MPTHNSHHSKPEAGMHASSERRTKQGLRLIFEEACRITSVFYDPRQGWGGASLTMYARQTLRDTYPDLTQQEIAILFSAVGRFHKTAPRKQ